MKWTIRSVLAVLVVALVVVTYATADRTEADAEFDLELAGEVETLPAEMEGEDLALEGSESSLVEVDSEVDASGIFRRRRRRRRRHVAAPPPPPVRHHHHHHHRHHHRRRNGIAARIARAAARAARKAAHKSRKMARKAARKARSLARRLGRGLRRFGRRVRRTRIARKAGSAARRLRRVAHKAARKLRRASKKTAKIIARSSAIRSLAKQMNAAGHASRKALLKSPKKLADLARKLKISAAKVKKAISFPKKMMKKAHKMAKDAKKALRRQIKKNKRAAKKAAKKAKKTAKKVAGGKSGKFQPKGVNMKKTPLTQKLKKVVENEPESAAVTKAKNNWAWEDKVVKRLDTYVPPDPRDIKHRIGAFESEADDACQKAEVLCVQSNLDHPVNGKTCQKAQKACFHAKVALRVIREASVVCVEAEVPCASKHWNAKGKCLVSKAKCKRLLTAADYQYDKIHKVGKKVRDAHFNDQEANLAIDSVNKQSVEVRKAQADHDEAEAKAMKCAETISTAKTCELNMDESPKCVKAQKDVTVCKAVVKDFRKLQKNLKKQIKRIDFAISRRNAAQTEAKIGAAY